MQRPGSHGFTLFELLVAMAVFAIVSATAYTGLIQVENAQKQLDVTQTHLANIELTFLNFGRDLRQVVPRPIRNQYGTERPAIAGQGDYLLELTRGGLRNPAQVARSTLQRVAYIVEDENLERLNWLVLDQAQDSLPVKQILLKKITSIDIRFLDQNNNWSNLWPPQDTVAPGQAPVVQAVFPRAVSVKLELPDVGTIERIFLMPEV